MDIYLKKFQVRRFASVSLAISLVDMLIFGVLIGLVHLGFSPNGTIDRVAGLTYLIGVPASFLCAILGLIYDRRRLAAAIAFGAAMACGYFCTLQVLV
jgi:hypothetical protein